MPVTLPSLCSSGLANDSEPETFSLKHEVEGKPVPFQYIKICKHLVCSGRDACSQDLLGVRLDSCSGRDLFVDSVVAA